MSRLLYNNQTKPYYRRQAESPSRSPRDPAFVRKGFFSPLIRLLVALCSHYCSFIIAGSVTTPDRPTKVSGFVFLLFDAFTYSHSGKSDSYVCAYPPGRHVQVGIKSEKMWLAAVSRCLFLPLMGICM